MSKVKNIEILRDHAIQTLLKLESGEIDTGEAGVTHKLYESVISTCKAEMEYNKMLDREIVIPFLETRATVTHKGTSRVVKSIERKNK